MNLRSFNLHHDYSISVPLSNVGKLSTSWIPKNNIQGQKEKKILTSFVYVVHKTWIEAFSSRSCAVTANKGTKKSDARAYQTYCFCDVLVFVGIKLKQRRWQQQQQRHPGSEFVPFQTWSLLFLSFNLSTVGDFFKSWNLSLQIEK